MLYGVTPDHILGLIASASDRPPEVQQRLQWFLHFSRGRSVAGTCRHFGIARSTFYRWAQRFDLNNLATLEDSPTINGKADNDAVVLASITTDSTDPVEHTEESIGYHLRAIAKKLLRSPSFVFSLTLHIAVFLMMLRIVAMESEWHALRAQRTSPASAFTAAVASPDFDIQQ